MADITPTHAQPPEEHHVDVDAVGETTPPAGAFAADGADRALADHRSRAVAIPERLDRQPQPLVWAGTGEPVGATLAFVPPFERRVTSTHSGQLVTGVRVRCALSSGQGVHVDLAAARTRMASVWDDRHPYPIALLGYPTDDEPAEEPDTAAHDGAVAVTTDVVGYLSGSDPTTQEYPNLATALLTLLTADQ